MRSSTSTLPISSPDELGAAGVGVLAGDFFAILADHRVDAGVVAEDAEVFFDLFEQFGVLVDELFLLEIDELAERHLEDRFGLDWRERIFLGDATFWLVLLEADFAESAFEH